MNRSGGVLLCEFYLSQIKFLFAIDDERAHSRDSKKKKKNKTKYRKQIWLL